jgi:hypothetical protein
VAYQRAAPVHGRALLAGGDPVARPVPKLLRLVARAARDAGLRARSAFAGFMASGT